MNLRSFGNTGMRVSEIGLGAWQLANPDWNLHDKDEALRIVQTALNDPGCNFFFFSSSRRSTPAATSLIPRRAMGAATARSCSERRSSRCAARL